MTDMGEEGHLRSRIYLDLNVIMQQRSRSQQLQIRAAGHLK